MTKFGKTLVFVNLILSLALMIWAMSAFVHRIDWSDNKAKDGKPDGELVRRIARVKAAWLPLPQSENDWRASRQNLLALEERRRDVRTWYDSEMAKLDKDANPNQPTPLFEVVTDLAGMPALEPNGRIKLQAAKDWGTINAKGERELKPVVARNAYDLRESNLFLGDDKQEAPLKEGLLASRTRLRKGVEDNVETITRMLGPKGLHARMLDEKAKREGVVEEYKGVQPLLINTAATSNFATERVKELQTRVAELEEKRIELRRKLGIAGE